MPRFYREKTFQFKLANYDVEEEFSIWKAYNQKGDVLNPETNQPYKFPIREGSDLKGTDGIVRKVGPEMKFMKRADFEKAYPGMARNTRYIRPIIVDNELYLYRFSYTVNNEIEKNIALLKGVGKDPLSVTFKQTFDRNKSPRQMYSLEVVGEVKTQPVQPTLTQQQKEAIEKTVAQIGKTVNTGLILDATEQAVYDAIMNLPIKIDKQKFVKVFTDNKVPSARAEQIYQEKYVKEKR